MNIPPFPFKGAHLRRYKQIAILLMRYGRDDLLRVPGAAGHFGEDELEEKGAKSEEFAAELERMGPTFVKIGQLLSTRADLLQEPLLEALARLQDDVAPVPFADIEKTVAGELGVRISKAFESFEEEPLASASLGQVHRATLHGGREVAVKVQRPGIRQQVIDDLDSLSAIGKFADGQLATGGRFQFAEMVDEFRRSILRELDYAQEAQNLERFGEALARFENIRIPAPVRDYCSPRVLTMDYIAGESVTGLSGVVLNDIDGAALAGELFHAYLYQILVLGAFHADPHPGNVLVTRDRGLALIDLGMVGYIPEPMRETLAHFLIAVAEHRGADAAECAIRLGEPTGDFDKNGFTATISQLVSERAGAAVGAIQVGGLVLAVTKTCADHGLRIPSAVVMLGKTLLNLDLVGKKLDAEFDPSSAIRKRAASLLRQQAVERLSFGAALATARDLRDLVADLPARANQVLELLAENKVKVEVDAVDEKLVIRSLQSIANRITAGLIIAAMIVGAAMLMHIDTQWKVLGYPALAIVLFLLAVGGGMWVALGVLFKDD